LGERLSLIKMTKYDIVTMGSGLVDVFVQAGLKEKGNFLSLPVGTKIQIDEIDFAIGGGAINAARCFAHFGFKTGFMGKIGSGYNGNTILNELKREGVDFVGVSGKEHSGYSIILEDDKKNRTVLTYRGASNNLKFSEIDMSRLETNWFYFTSMGDESFESQKKLAVYASKRGIKISYNPSSYHTKKGAGYIGVILKNCDFLSLNKEEARMLVKKGDLFKGLRRLGPKIVSITDGKNEGGIYDGNILYRYWPNKVKVVEATGAGDVFASSFVSGFIKFNDVEKAIKCAIVNAESYIQTKGSQKGLLKWNEIENLIKKTKFKIKKEEK